MVFYVDPAGIATPERAFNFRPGLDINIPLSDEMWNRHMDPWQRIVGRYNQGKSPAFTMGVMQPIERTPRPSLGAKVGGALKTLRSPAARIHQAGWHGVKSEMGIGVKSPFWRWAGRAFIGYSIYAGYQEGGIGGAVAGGVSHLASMYLFSAGMKVAGMGASMGAPVAAAAIGAGGIALGVSMASGQISPRDFVRPWVNQYMKKHAQLELATPVVDNFGTVATMRQRSLQAIQNSRINGRTALGNEAALSYQPYFR